MITMKFPTWKEYVEHYKGRFSVIHTNPNSELWFISKNMDYYECIHFGNYNNRTCDLHKEFGTLSFLYEAPELTLAFLKTYLEEYPRTLNSKESKDFIKRFVLSLIDDQY